MPDSFPFRDAGCSAPPLSVAVARLWSWGRDHHGRPVAVPADRSRRLNDIKQIVVKQSRCFFRAIVKVKFRKKVYWMKM